MEEGTGERDKGGGGGGWKLVVDVSGSIYGSFGDVLSSPYTSTYLYKGLVCFYGNNDTAEKGCL